MASDVEIIFTPWPYDAVARGVGLLDERAPGWRETADHELVVLWTLAGKPDYMLYGFDTPGLSSYLALRRAWREAIVGGEA